MGTAFEGGDGREVNGEGGGGGGGVGHWSKTHRRVEGSKVVFFFH